MLIRLSGSGPLRRQVYQTLRRTILEGKTPPGSRLPSTRSLAATLGVSRNIVLLAFDQLLAEGYIEGRRGSGTYVASALPEAGAGQRPRPRRPADAGAPARLSAYGHRAVAEAPIDPRPAGLPYDFRYGLALPDRRTLTVWRRLIGRQASRLPLDYAPAQGHPALRSALARALARNRGVVCDPDQVLVVSGSQQALDLAARLLLDPGDRVVIEEPHYQGARRVLTAAGATLVPVAVDGEGLDLTGHQKPPRARLAYVTPSHQFPTGAVMPLARRLALLEWAEACDAYVLEDDYDSEYRYEGSPVEAVQGLDTRGRTIYIGTLSKVLFPSMRLGFLVLPPPLVPAFVAGKWLADRHTPLLEQLTLAEFLDAGHFDRHLRRMRRLHARRRAALIEALDTHLGDRVSVMGTQAGLHLLVWLPEVPAARVPGLIARAARAGVGIYSIAPYYMEPPAAAGLLLGYGTLTEADIHEGIRRLALALRGGRRPDSGSG